MQIISSRTSLRLQTPQTPPPKSPTPVILPPPGPKNTPIKSPPPGGPKKPAVN